MDRHPTIHILNIRAPPIHPIDIQRTRAKHYPDLILRDQPPSDGPWKLHRRGTHFPNLERPTGDQRLRFVFFPMRRQ
jgi:hypothetical protein